MSDMLTLARARYDEARSAFTKAQAALDAPAADADLDAIIATADEARKACDSAKETLDRAESLERARAAHKPVEETKPAAREVVVGNEERTYRPDKPGTSFFKDLTLARTGDQPAFDRLARNNAEVYESRAISQTATAGGEFVAPLWLNDLYAPLFRAGRPFVDAIGTKPLPPATNSINLPRITTGNSAAAQSDGGAVSNTDLVTTSVTAQVQTVAGRTIASYQLVDLATPAFDQVIYQDLVAAYAAQFDTLAINGSATNAKGVLNVTGINAVTYTTATPAPVSATVANSAYYQVFLGKNAIEKGAFVPVDFALAHPSFWNWFLTGIDSQTRPLAIASTGVNGFNALGAFDPRDVPSMSSVAGNIAGIPVISDANIPTNLGAGTNESRLVLVNRRGFDIWESQPVFKIADQTSLANLQYQFVLYGYYAVASRQPKMVSVVAGTGMIVQSGF